MFPPEPSEAMRFFSGRVGLQSGRRWRTDHVNKFQTRLGFQQLLDAFRILNAWHLHENPIRTLRAVSLHERFSDAELVEPRFNDLAALVRLPVLPAHAARVCDSVHEIVLPLTADDQSVTSTFCFTAF